MKKNALKWLSYAIIAIGYLLLIHTFLAYYFFDDLGFDFLGYSVRYNFAFDFWNNQLLQGVPTSLFDPFIPSLLPLLFKALGVGEATLPLTLSLFVLRALIPVVFYFIGKKLGASTHAALLAGVLFILNPFTYRFLNRYYELAGWLFFLIAFYFLISTLKEKKLFTKDFAYVAIFASLAALSHLSIMIFLVPCFFFFSQNIQQIKKTFFILASAFLIGSFWFIPFLYYQSYSVIGATKGYLLSTPGIFFANVALLLILFLTTAILFYIKKKNHHNSKHFLLFCGLILLVGVAKFLAPWLPVLGIPFTHSFNVFYIFAILCTWLWISTTKIFNVKHFIALFLIFLVFFAVGFSRFSGQYFFEEPKLSTYSELNGFEFEKIQTLLSKIPANYRYETIPYDPVVSAYSSLTGLPILNLLGYGYDPYAINQSYEEGLSIVSMELPCEEFKQKATETATSYFIAMSIEGNNYLSNCELKRVEGIVPALFSMQNPMPIIQNGEILSLTKNEITVKTKPPLTTIKINNFPKWNADNSVIQGSKWVELPTDQEQTVTLKIMPTLIEQLCLVLSIISITSLLFLSFKKG